MGLTTIPIKKETRDKLREFAKKSESWDDLLNRLHENALSVDATNVFFVQETLTIDEALEEIDKW